MQIAMSVLIIIHALLDMVVMLEDANSSIPTYDQNLKYHGGLSFAGGYNMAWSECLMCEHSKATSKMEIICYHRDGSGGCSNYTRTHVDILIQDCKNCIRYKVCTYAQDGIPLECKFFDMRGDTKDIVRPQSTSRWKKIHHDQTKE